MSQGVIMIFDYRFLEKALKKPPTTQGDESDFPLKGFSTDSRTISALQCFIGIRGENFDGNLYAPQAAEKGVKVFILEKHSYKKVIAELGRAWVWVVSDALSALGQLAKQYKNEIFCSVLALTGSSGKTTTRELLVSILSKKYNVHSAKKNLNNEIGLPLTMLDAPPTSHIMVLEMGMNHPGEIMRLSQVCDPLVGMITNVGYAHIGLLGSRDAIADAKSEIFTGLNPRGYMFLNRDDDYYEYFYKKCPAEVRDFGLKDIEILEDRGLEGYLLKYKDREFSFPLPGEHNLQNLSAGLAIGDFYQVHIDDILAAVQDFSAVSQRTEIIKKNGLTIINDCYNANPSSMQAALKMLSGLEGHRVAVISDMLELGRHTADLHKMIGAFIIEQDCAHQVLAYGKHSKEIISMLGKAGKDAHWAEDLEGLVDLCKTRIPKDSTVLVKASRGMHLETVVKALSS